jgi:hypothetical protein
MLKGYEFIYVIYHKFAVYVNVTVLDLVARGLIYKQASSILSFIDLRKGSMMHCFLKNG